MAVQNGYLQLPVCADASLRKCLLQGLKGNFGAVILIAQMGQADVAKIFTNDVTKKGSALMISQMTMV